MEAVILLGVLAGGYFINEDKEKRQQVHTEVQPPLFVGSGNTIYDMNNVKDAQKYEIDQVRQHHEESMRGDSKVIDHLNMEGRNTLRDTSISSDKIQSMSGDEISKEGFFVRDHPV